MIKLLGAIFLVGGCTGFGWILAISHRREVLLLRQLRRAIQEMQWELKFRLTALPELCFLAADAAGGRLKPLFAEFGNMLARGEVADISGAFQGLLMSAGFPARVKRNLRQLGDSLGRFDLEGQLEGLEAVRRQCSHDLKELEALGPDRLKNYRTLAVCAGVALAILFL